MEGEGLLNLMGRVADGERWWLARKGRDQEAKGVGQRDGGVVCGLGRSLWGSGQGQRAVGAGFKGAGPQLG